MKIPLTLLKYTIYDKCIDILFEKVKQNFLDADKRITADQLQSFIESEVTRIFSSTNTAQLISTTFGEDGALDIKFAVQKPAGMVPIDLDLIFK